MTAASTRLNGFSPAVALSDTDLIYVDQNGEAKATLAQFRTALSGNRSVETFVAGTNFTAGTTTSLTLAGSYGSISNVDVYFDGVPQLDCSLSGNTLSFNPVIAAGTQQVVVKGGAARSIGVPADASVSDAKIATGSKLFRRVFNVIDITDYPGADATGATYSDAALVAALAKASTMGSAKISIPAGKFKFSALATYTFPNLVAGLMIEGAGVGITELSWACADGLKINYLGAFNSFQLRGVTYSTSTTGGGNGIFLNQTGTGITDPGNSALNIFDGVVFQGADGQAKSQYWGEAVHVYGVSNINFFNMQVTGPLEFYSVHGIGVNVFGTASLIPVVYNFVGCTFNLLNVGFVYGLAVQGVTFTGCNFTGDSIGIGCNPGVPDGSLVQLSVVNCQFNCITAINSPSQIQDVQVSNCEFLIPNLGEGVVFGKSYNFSFVGNHFSPAVFGATCTAISVDVSQSGSCGIITGNMFWKLTNGVILQSGSDSVNVQSNAYKGNTNNVVNLGTNNTVGGGSQ
jgi:hypothetical protein